MAFDEGQSPEAWTIVLSVWAYPLFPLLMAIGDWVTFAFRKNRLAALLSGISFVPPALSPINPVMCRPGAEECAV